MLEEDFSARPRIADTENITRYVGGSHFDSKTKKLNGSAFDRTRKDTDGLSVNRVGLLANDEIEDRKRLREVVGSRIKFGRNAQFIELNTADILQELEEFEQAIFLCHDPLAENPPELANPAHGLIIGLPFVGEAIGSLRSEYVGDRLKLIVRDIFPAIETEVPPTTKG